MKILGRKDTNSSSSTETDMLYIIVFEELEEATLFMRDFESLGKECGESHSAGIMSLYKDMIKGFVEHDPSFNGYPTITFFVESIPNHILCLWDVLWAYHHKCNECLELHAQFIKVITDDIAFLKLVNCLLKTATDSFQTITK